MIFILSAISVLIFTGCSNGSKSQFYAINSVEAGLIIYQNDLLDDIGYAGGYIDFTD